METIQVVIEAPLLKAADRAARRLKLNRSAFIREAVRSHLRTLQRVRDLEDADREGYERVVEAAADLAWERAAAWPKD